MRRCTLASILLLVAVAACGGGDDFTPTLEQPWHPPGPGHQAECTDQCVPVLTSDSHHGDYTIWTNPADDSPRAQWGKCFVQVMACWDPGVELAGCTAAADRCPQPCRDEVVRLGDDETAFERVFLDDDAPCRQPDEEVSP